MAPSEVRLPPSVNLCKHVIVCVFGDARAPSLGLRNFIMPLRASCFTYDELKTIVLVGSLDYLTSEWHSINYFPKLFIMMGSPLCRADLKSVNIGCCDMCVILSSNWVKFKEKPLQDKECVLATLNIKGMLFEESLADEQFSSISLGMNVDPFSCVAIPVNESSVRYLDQESWDEADIDLYLTRPYASGCVFAANILNSLMCATYFNENILTLIRTLVTGGATHELEEQLGDEDVLRGGSDIEHHMVNRQRSPYRVIIIDNGNYGDLFCKALNVYGILCFGLFRLQNSKFESKARYVITNPPGNFKLNNTDFVMCSVPYKDIITIETPTYCWKNYSAKFITNPTHHRKSITFVPPVRVSLPAQVQSRPPSIENKV
uniref:Calcium-activated potassium channel subunit alpha-1-like n=1 Tax=Callorhinchus milii TaxID=7868 RepID=A0A4W3GG77_CALMI